MSLLYTFSPIYYMLYSMLLLLAGLVGQMKQRTKDWNMIILSGATEVLANGVSLGMRFHIIAQQGSGEAGYLLNSLLYMTGYVFLAVGLYKILGKTRDPSDISTGQF